MIHPQAIQQCGVQVMNRHTVFNRLEAELIRSAVNESTFDSAPSENHCETVRIVIPAGAAFRNWSATELATPQHQSFIEFAAALQIPNQCGCCLIHVGAALDELAINVKVIVPSTIVDVHVAHALLDEPARHKARSRIR